ncbi:MAG: hypothetical protein AB1458_06220 [Bacteroidota bacterium]
MQITAHLPVDGFERIKQYVLDHGDRQTYRNYDNNSPHYSFEAFDVYLSPSIGQRNINCDPLLSDFNEIVVRDGKNDPLYCIIRIVRKGDRGDPRIYVPEGFYEDNVYLYNVYKEDPDKLRENLLNIYLPEIKKVMSASL